MSKSSALSWCLCDSGRVDLSCVSLSETVLGSITGRAQAGPRWIAVPRRRRAPTQSHERVARPSSCRVGSSHVRRVYRCQRLNAFLATHACRPTSARLHFIIVRAGRAPIPYVQCLSTMFLSY